MPNNILSGKVGRRLLLTTGLVTAAVAATGLPAITPSAFAKEEAVAKAAPKQTKPLVIRNIAIGEGKPKTIVPITAKDPASVRSFATKIGADPSIDLIEFRVDYLEIALNAEAVAELSKDVAGAINGKPLLVTFRTKAEGGVTAIDDKAYADFYETIVKKGKVDLIDVELVRDEKAVRRIVKAAHAAGVAVVMSNHDFHATAEADELVRRLRKMEVLGADVLKLAAMPKDAGDVLKLLTATWEMRSRYTEKPMITMAMGGTGVVSRLTGEVFGSAATFGMVGQASAPGQIDVHALQSVLETINKAITGA
ncbi:type I 3-dehydroquinate dehydratase [Rhodomicrobium lacus]|uniref:type I 3-dehydroquinate dehydratase n=1 Tax=Rhodomicrobium lacus TaxID=2498452 RepID=UPI0026E11AF8|nr:type I 3-dehydroquinate dehydratase [Rhodomicrobium lacus]WKW50126.1 type I 3-dehydroquinate dehydratase [Rhodomicrobium lacus]